MRVFKDINKKARFAFNVFNVETIQGVLLGAKRANVEVYIQTSASTVKYYGAAFLGSMIKQCAQDQSIQLHLDHCLDVSLIKDCLEAGWSSVMIDASGFDLAENIEKTSAVVAMAHDYGAIAEGEIGAVGGEEDGFEGGRYAVSTELKEVEIFYDQTKVDLLAIGIGTQHGHYEGKVAIDLPLLHSAHKLLPDVPIVLHGGTGVPLDQISDSILNGGVRKINISTELKDTHYAGINEHLENSAKFHDMIDLLRCPKEKIADFVENKCLEISKIK